jgi:hypothetical protein
MALYVDNKPINTIYRGEKTVQAVYQGLKLIWQYIRSCFGRGYWINEKQWSESDGWAN